MLAARASAVVTVVSKGKGKAVERRGRQEARKCPNCMRMAGYFKYRVLHNGSLVRETRCRNCNFVTHSLQGVGSTTRPKWGKTGSKAGAIVAAVAGAQSRTSFFSRVLDETNRSQQRVEHDKALARKAEKRQKAISTKKEARKHDVRQHRHKSRGSRG